MNCDERNIKWHVSNGKQNQHQHIRIQYQTNQRTKCTHRVVFGTIGGVGGVKMGEQPLQLEFVDKIVVLVCLLWLWLSVVLMFVSAGLFELPVQV